MVQLLAQIENYQHNLTVQPEKFRSRAESVLGRGWESGFPQNIPASMIQRGIFITFRRENFVATDGTRQRASTADRDHIPPPLFRVYHNDDGYSFSPKSVPSLMQRVASDEGNFPILFIFEWATSISWQESSFIDQFWTLNKIYSSESNIPPSDMLIPANCSN